MLLALNANKKLLGCTLIDLGFGCKPPSSHGWRCLANTIYYTWVQWMLMKKASDQQGKKRFLWLSQMDSFYIKNESF